MFVFLRSAGCNSHIKLGWLQKLISCENTTSVLLKYTQWFKRYFTNRQTYKHIQSGGKTKCTLTQLQTMLCEKKLDMHEYWWKWIYLYISSFNGAKHARYQAWSAGGWRPCQHYVWSVREINMVKYVHTKNTVISMIRPSQRAAASVDFCTATGKQKATFSENEIYIPCFSEPLL